MKPCMELVGAALHIRRASHCDAQALTTIAIESKATWGYSRQFMAACREELTVCAQALRDPACDYFIGEHDGNMVAFYGLGAVELSSPPLLRLNGQQPLEPSAAEALELVALFVTPGYIGRGVGRRLIEHAKTRAVARGARVLLIQSDPHAQSFYLAVGAKRVGERASGSIAGRMLPLFEIALEVPAQC